MILLSYCLWAMAAFAALMTIQDFIFKKQDASVGALLTSVAVFFAQLAGYPL